MQLSFPAKPNNLRSLTHRFSCRTPRHRPLRAPRIFNTSPGVRPAFIEQDAKTTPLFNAKGESLGFDLGQWLSANGKVTITPSPDGKAKISAQFSKLRPGASYSLFENHFDQQPVGFTPLDGVGKNNNFHSDKKGAGRVTLTAPQMLTHANAVLLVYHSDKTFHGEQRGEVDSQMHRP